MKDHRCWYLTPLMTLFIAASAFASSPSNVIITFDHPERFTDFRVQGRTEQESAVKFAAEMMEALEPTVAQQAPNSTLVLQFNDIDLGGRYKPQRTRRLTNVRFHNNGHEPVRMYFEYTLADSSGRVLAKGSDSATDALRLGKYTSEPVKLPYKEFYFEKQTLISWIKNKIGGQEPNLAVREKR
ncbi:MAG: DUF3016 domain-containing protein [Verrucomicrobia bacterium]|nr:DUF3016 domain-containing protein [Verrucomicrobiota bacterium]